MAAFILTNGYRNAKFANCKISRYTVYKHTKLHKYNSTNDQGKCMLLNLHVHVMYIHVHLCIQSWYHIKSLKSGSPLKD